MRCQQKLYPGVNNAHVKTNGNGLPKCFLLIGPGSIGSGRPSQSLNKNNIVSNLYFLLSNPANFECSPCFYLFLFFFSLVWEAVSLTATFIYLFSFFPHKMSTSSTVSSPLKEVSDLHIIALSCFTALFRSQAGLTVVPTEPAGQHKGKQLWFIQMALAVAYDPLSSQNVSLRYYFNFFKVNE